MRLKAQIAKAYYRLRYPRFYALRKQAGGMLSPAVYERIYKEIQLEPDLDVVEIGGAAGAGSIALYQGMRDSGKHARLVVVERCEGGSRSDFGGREENLRQLQENFRSFGVTENVKIFPHELTIENGEEVLRLCTTRELAAFIHDADGHIDRDFSLFWPRLRSRGLIIIDDYDPLPHFVDVSARYPEGGIKGVLTYRLINQFIDWGLFESTAKVGITLFGRKPAAARWSYFNLDRCREIHESVKRERDEQLKMRRHIP